MQSNHQAVIQTLRSAERHVDLDDTLGHLDLLLADLLELHDRESLSLDNWAEAKWLFLNRTGIILVPNGV